MVSRVSSFAFLGIEAVPVDVQVHFSSGLPAFNIVGLADKAVAESKRKSEICAVLFGALASFGEDNS